ncbi:MAG: translation initiation factor IF-2 [Endomicrobium sp.]|jgi:translation initiation factor IF-2|nr:translation initiation factor IF-2 [Endomicrobium sp.]
MLNNNKTKSIKKQVKLNSNDNANLRMKKQHNTKVNNKNKTQQKVIVKTRPPIVTIMGHVDHGKTSLLDAIRQSNIISSEYGHITQHIGAYRVNNDQNNFSITFLDTPGHEIFSIMRSRGIKLTDIILLVVSATEGIKSQTIEVINQAKTAKVPIIVAINKIDLPNADPKKITYDLSTYGLIDDMWGGDTIIVKVSAIQKINIKLLLEMIELKAEMMELKANYSTKGTGIVIEAKLDPHLGAVAILLIQDGIVKVDDNLVIGNTYAKIRIMFNEFMEKLSMGLPSTPITICGINEIPCVGDAFVVVNSETEAKDIANQRKAKINKINLSKKSNIDLLLTINSRKNIPELTIMLKADVQGSLEALESDILRISKNITGVNLKIISRSIGLITKSDVNLAVISNAVIIAFNIKLSKDIANIAKYNKIKINIYKVLPEVSIAVKNMMSDMLKPHTVQKILGKAIVKQIFKLSNNKIIYGCYVINGTIYSNSQIQLLRDNKIIFSSKITSLKRFKENVKEVGTGHECGISLNKVFKEEIKLNDTIESFIIEKLVNVLK